MADIVLSDLKFLCKKFSSQKLAAKALKISPQYLNDILKGNRPVPNRVAAKIGWELVKTWVKK